MSNKIERENFQVILEPMGKRVEVDPGTTIFEAAIQGGVELTAVCGGTGTCGKCKVYPFEGHFSELTQFEKDLLSRNELGSGLRLACLTNIRSNATTHFPPESLATMQRLQLEGKQSDIKLNPVVSSILISLPIQNRDTGIAEISRALEKETASLFSDLKVSENLLLPSQKIMLDNRGKAKFVIRNNSVIHVLAPEDHVVGFACDIGTTKIAGYLVDMENGETLASGGIANPQIPYGEDVINRIKYADENLEGGKVLQEVLVKSINELINRLSIIAQITREQIVDCVMVGNTAMHHLLVGLPVHPLGTAPYMTEAINSMNLPAGDIGLDISKGAYIYLPPNIAGFVGGDHVAMLLSTNARNLGKTVLAIDIGTNTEISLIHNGLHLACSCASGPAFEGAHIREGIKAIPGAIEKVFIDKNAIKVHTIENKPAIGICGSGILDAVSEMHRVGILDIRGTFTKNDSRLSFSSGKPEFILVGHQQTGVGRDITLNRRDVNQIQLAKAAIRSGIEVLIEYAGITTAEIELVFLAGAFGTYLDISSAMEIGMFPRLPLERFFQVGNAAGSGAREMLLSTQQRENAEKIMDKIKYIELTIAKNYSDIFMNAIGF
jgi:uncharacterized 2Fe-2S/4Fe-4S cluster protein (DUF4445 family)